jgi:ABC-type spermidine/putrescine transport system permease subunit I
MVHLCTIFIVSPIFFSIARTDKDVVEAVRDIGASEFQGFKTVTLPIIMPGVFEGEKVCSIMSSQIKHHDA